jgi:uncharacterized protein
MGGEPEGNARVSIIADTSGLFALLDGTNRDHPRVRPFHKGLIVPSTVLSELDHLATKRLGPCPVREFYRSIERGYVTHVPLEEGVLKRAFELLDSYADAHIGLVDASIVALAERYRVPRILTLDRRHFSMFRPQGLSHLELLP